MTTRRARDAGQKAARRRQLLVAAGARLDLEGWHALTMAEVAESAGLAKGTTYLYYRSKEELFLDLLVEETSAWSAEAALGIGELRDDRADAVAGALVESLHRRPRLLALLALRRGVLVPGAGEAAPRLDLRLGEALAPLATRLEERLPRLGLGGGEAWLHGLLALAAGLSAPDGAERDSPPARLAECLAALLRGWRAPELGRAAPSAADAAS